MRRLGLALIATVLLPFVGAGEAVAAQVVATYQVGAGPSALATDPTTGRVYVANSGVQTRNNNGSISVIEPSTGAVSVQDTTLPSGQLAIDAGARRLYSSNSLSNGASVSLDVIDLDTGRWLTSLAVGGLGVAVDSSRSRVFVAGGQYLASVDTGTYAMNIRSAPFPQFWAGVATDPIRGRVYVTNADAAHPSLVVLDASDLHTIADIGLPMAARYALAADASRDRVYVAGPDPAGGTSHIAIVDGASLAVRSQALPFFTTGLALAATSHRVWVTNFDFRELVGLDDETLMNAETVTVLPWSAYSALFARDGLLYLSAPGASVVGALDVTVPQPPVNRAPIIESATVSPTQAATNDVVTVAVRAHDPDGDPIAIRYQWYVNTTGVAGQQHAIPGETSASLDLSRPGHGDRDDLLCVDMKVTDGTLTTSSLWCMLFVLDSAPVASVALNTTTPATNETLTAVASATDADGDAVTFVYTWRRGGIVVRESATAATTDMLDLSQGDTGDVGDVITVTVVAADDRLRGAPVMATATVRNTPPSIAIGLSDAGPSKHDMLLASVSAFDADAQPLVYTFTWSVGGLVKSTVSGPSPSSTFDLRAARAANGDSVTVDVTVSDGAAVAGASASAVVAPPGH